MIPILLFGGYSPFWAGFIAPFFFGVAHIHHIFHFIFIDKKPVLMSLVSVLFQFIYTTLFGWYSAFLYIQTNTVLAPFLAHAFCNSMGFPDFGGIKDSSFPKVLLFVYCFGLVSFLCLLNTPQWYIIV